MTYNIYSKDGELRCEAPKIEYNGKFMGESSITVSIRSERHIGFEIGDYIEYRGEAYTLFNVPTEKKVGTGLTEGEIYQYDSMKLLSYSGELSNADFNDFVGGSDTDRSFTAQPSFSFVAATIGDLAERIQVNMDRYYTGSMKWTILVDEGYITDESKRDMLITVSNITCWDALGYANSKYGTNFTVKGRTVTIGGTGAVRDIVFKVGRHNGLYDLTRNMQQGQGIVTKMMAYGNTTNLNPRYYSLVGTKVWANAKSWMWGEKDGVKRIGAAFDIDDKCFFGNITASIINNGYTLSMKKGSSEYTDEVSGMQDIGESEAMDTTFSMSEKEATMFPINLHTIPKGTYTIYTNRLMVGINPTNEAVVNTNTVLYIRAAGCEDVDLLDITTKVSGGADYTYIPIKTRIVQIPNDMQDAELCVSIRSVYAGEGYKGVIQCKIKVEPSSLIMVSKEDRYPSYFIHSFASGEDSLYNEIVGKIKAATDITTIAHTDILSGAIKESISDLSHITIDTASALPNNMNVANLMLPGFPSKTLAQWVDENKGRYTWLQGYLDNGYTFSEERFYPYINSPSMASIGIRPHTEYFTSEDTTHKDIYPSLQYFTDERNKITGCTDVDGAEITDSGVFADGETVKKIYIRIKDLGFDFSDVVTSKNTFTLHINSGYCGGKDFTVDYWEKDPASGEWKLRCQRLKDDGIGKYFPYAGAPIKAGDKFVITDLYMSDVYIEQASIELLKWAMMWLVKNDYSVASYTLTPSEIFIKRHDDAISDKSATFHAAIREGDLLYIEDNDIGVSGAITIDSIKITEGDSILPKYEITLKDTDTVGTIEKIQNQIEAITGGNAIDGLQISDAIRQMIKESIKYGFSMSVPKGFDSSETNVDDSGKINAVLKYSDGYFLPTTTQKKLWDDKYTMAQTDEKLLLKLDKSVWDEAFSIESKDGEAYVHGNTGYETEHDIQGNRLISADGTRSTDYSTASKGYSIYKDNSGNWHIEADVVDVRKKITAPEIEIQRITHINGGQLLTAASMTVVRVDATGAAYRCYMRLSDADGNKITNDWKAGDQAYCKTFNIEKQADGTMGNRYYWRLVSAVGADYIDLSKSDKDSLTGDISPSVGDNIVQLGYRGGDDAGRTSAMFLVGAGVGAPYMKQYKGIVSYTLPEPSTVFSPDGNRITGDLVIQSTGTTVESELAKRDKYTLTLSNEMAGVSCDSTGNVTGTLPTSEVHIYEGTSDVTSQWSVALTPTGCTASYSGGVVTVLTLTADSATVNVAASKSGEALRSKTIYISKVKAGAAGDKAIVYHLIPSATVIKKGKDGVITPASITCSAVKAVGGTTSVATGAEVTIYYSVDGGSESVYPAPIPITDTMSYLAFRLSKDGETLDRQTVQILEDTGGMDIGIVNLLPWKYFTDWNDMGYGTITTVSEDSEYGKYFAFDILKAYQSISSYSTLDIFQGKIGYKANTQYCIKYRARNMRTDNNTTLCLYIFYTDGTQGYCAMGVDNGNYIIDNDIQEYRGVTQYGKTVSRIAISYLYQDETRFYDICITEGNVVPSGYPIAKIDQEVLDKSFSSQIKVNEDNITSVTNRVKGAETNITTLQQTAQGLSATILSGDQLIRNGSGEMLDNTNFKFWEFDAAQKYNGSMGSFTYTRNKSITLYPGIGDNSNTSVIYDKEPNGACLVAVNPSDKFLLSVDAKSLNGVGMLYMWAKYWDIDKKSISGRYVMYRRNTTTTLLSDLNNGDTVVHLAGNSNWENTTSDAQRGFIFWNYTDSTGHTYPAETYSRNAWSGLYDSTGISVGMDTGGNITSLEITLKSPWANGTFKAGTKVSQTEISDDWSYKALSYQIIPKSWATYSIEIQGYTAPGYDSAYNFFHGTAYISFGFLWNYQYKGANDTSSIVHEDQIWITNVIFSRGAYRDKRMTTIEATASGLSLNVAKNTTDITNINASVDGIRTTVASNSNDINSAKANISTIQQTINGVGMTVSEAVTRGKCLYPDASFVKGSNGCGVYLCASNITSYTSERIPDNTSPTGSGYVIHIGCVLSVSSNTFPGLYQIWNSYANAVFVQRIIAKIPVGYEINHESNAQGTNPTAKWLTPKSGTGDWAEYAFMRTCGSSGEFGSGGYLYIRVIDNNPNYNATSLDWYVAYLTSWDMTAPGSTFTEMQTQIKANTDGMTLMATKADLDSTNGRLTTAESNITANSNSISSKVSKSDYDANNTTINNRFSQIEQNADSISLKLHNSQRTNPNLWKKSRLPEIVPAPSGSNSQVQKISGSSNYRWMIDGELWYGFKFGTYDGIDKTNDVEFAAIDTPAITTCTVSFDFRCDIDGKSPKIVINGTEYSANVDSVLANTYYRLSASATLGTAVTQIGVSLRGVTQNHGIWARNFKVENATEATEWVANTDDCEDGCNYILRSRTLAKDMESADGASKDVGFSISSDFIKRAKSNVFTLACDITWSNLDYTGASSGTSHEIGLALNCKNGTSTVQWNEVWMLTSSATPTSGTRHISQQLYMDGSVTDIECYACVREKCKATISNAMLIIGGECPYEYTIGDEELLDTGIDIKNKKIRFTADNSTFQTNSGDVIAIFDADGIKAQRVICMNSAGQKVSSLNENGDGTLIYYYPSGKRMKGEFFTYDANGNVNGAETRYYNDDTDNTLAWKINNGGNREASLPQYWVQWKAYIVPESVYSSASSPADKESKVRSYILENANSIYTDSLISEFKCTNSGSQYYQYRNLIYRGNIPPDETPDGCTPFTGLLAYTVAPHKDDFGDWVIDIYQVSAGAIGDNPIYSDVIVRFAQEVDNGLYV